MRSLSICWLLVVTFAFSGMLYAQEEDPHVFTIVTFELLNPEDGSSAEFDSLGVLWEENVLKKNEFIISEVSMSHMWGDNSDDFVIITEFKSFADIEKSQNRNFELTQEAWPDKEERQTFWDAFIKYFGRHSDEIYQENTSVRN